MAHGVAVGGGASRRAAAAGRSGGPRGGTGTELLDLVCGPTSPLPETYQRYRLIAHLGSGGQADVYRAVRLCGGVSSAPMTVKVFRIDPRRPLADELRSWDKGDAALMDLNNRGVTGICRRADGFYGPPPHRPGRRVPGDAVPYQVYDYLHGVNLKEYVAQRAGLATGAHRLNAVAALRTLGGVLRALHHPQQTGATPVLHMDVKPSNVMVLTNGEIRLIDFTGARYWRAEEITQIAYTPESGGPEAFGGVSQLSPAYDVHGFGAVAYFLVTGEYPRQPGSSAAPRRPGSPDPGVPSWSQLRRHPTLEQLPVLRDHLHAPLADRPGDRPSTLELAGWVDRLGELVRRHGAADIGMDWSEPRADQLRAVGRATPRPPVAGTETDAYQRIEKLERELVELRATVEPRATPAPEGSAPASGDGAARHPAPQRNDAAESPGAARAAPESNGQAAAESRAAGQAAESRAAATRVAGEPGATRVNDDGRVLNAGSDSGEPPAHVRGRASVPPPKVPRIDPTDVVADTSAWRPAPREDPRTLKRGWELSGIGAVFAFICWGIWAATTRGRLTVPLVAFCIVLAVAAGVFAVTRLVGRIVLVQRMGRTRRSAKGAHALTGLFLAAAGVAYLRQTPWVIELYTWLRGLR